MRINYQHLHEKSIGHHWPSHNGPKHGHHHHPSPFGGKHGHQHCPSPLLSKRGHHNILPCGAKHGKHHRRHSPPRKPMHGKGFNASMMRHSAFDGFLGHHFHGLKHHHHFGGPERHHTPRGHDHHGADNTVNRGCCHGHETSHGREVHYGKGKRHSC